MLDSILHIYTFDAIALDESDFIDVLHFQVKNIKSPDLETTFMGSATSILASDVVCWSDFGHISPRRFGYPKILLLS